MAARADGKPRNRRAISARARAVVREKEVLLLRLAGLTFREIAETLGIGLGTAYRAFQRALTKTAQERAKYGEQELELQLLRLERMLSVAWDKALTGDLAAMDRVLRCIEKLVLYQGLEPAKKLNLGLQVEQEHLSEWLDMLKSAILSRSDGSPPEAQT